MIADPQEARPIRWGILAPGRIAHVFANAVQHGTQSRVVAVGSRSLDRASAFAKAHGVPRVHGSYDHLVSDDDVDAIYVASPPAMHAPHALLALDAGKPVLVEKAFAPSVAEANLVFDAARTKGLLAVEAMWSRFLPHYSVITQALHANMIGNVSLIRADHGIRLHPDGPARWGDRLLGGGSLLSLGVYPVSLADLVFDAIGATPERIRSEAVFVPSGVDASVTISIAASGGVLAQLASSMTSPTPCSAVISGDQGLLEISPVFYRPTTVRLRDRHGTLVDQVDSAIPDDLGFAYEAAEFAESFHSGRQESPTMPPRATLRTLDVLDQVRSQIGLTYLDPPC